MAGGSPSVARVALALVMVLLAIPGASAWEARFVSTPAAASLQEALLLAGALDASAPEGGFFGAPVAGRLIFDAPVDVVYCPDQVGEPQLDPACAQAELTTGARLYVLAGGLVARAPTGGLSLAARASAAALGGPNVTLNELPVGAAVYVGGEAVVRSGGGALAIRPLLSEASLEVRGNEGFRTYNGTAYTLHVTGFNESTLEARGAFLAAQELVVRVDRAGIARAEAELRVEELYDTLRVLQPPERADRRSLVAGAFGLFQLVPALLDGAAAARTNLTLDDEPRTEFTFVRLEDARFSHDGASWRGIGNATYMLDGEELVTRPGSTAEGSRWTIAIPVVLLLAAIGLRLLTYRAEARSSRRWLAMLVRVVGFVVLCFLVGATLAPLLGFSPVLDAPTLSLRSRVQLLLLVTGMALAAYLAIGLPAESIARSAFAWLDRPRALLVPVSVGVAGACLFALLATPLLLSFVARSVRL